MEARASGAVTGRRSRSDVDEGRDPAPVFEAAEACEAAARLVIPRAALIDDGPSLPAIARAPRRHVGCRSLADENAPPRLCDERAAG
jgi:hypothetical protein